MKKILIIILIAFQCINTFADCGGIYIESNAGGDNGFNQCMLGTIVEYKLGPWDYGFTCDASSVWYVEGGEIIAVDGQSVTPTKSYTIDFKRCFDNGNGCALGSKNNCMTIPVRIRWGKYDANGNLISGQQPNYASLLVDLKKGGSFGGCNKQTPLLSFSNLVDHVTAGDASYYQIQTSLPLVALTSPLTYGTTGSTKTLPIGTKVIYQNCSSNNLGFSMTNLANTTVVWSGPFKQLSCCSNTKGFNYNTSFSIPSSGSGPLDQFGRNIDFVTALVYNVCIIDKNGNPYPKNAQSIPVIAAPVTLTGTQLPKFNANAGSVAQMLNPVCDNQSYYLDMPYFANASYTATLPSGWSGSKNGINGNAFSFPADGSGLSLAYGSTTLTGYRVAPGIATVTSFQGCGIPQNIFLTLSGITDFTVSLTSGFVSGCAGQPITFSAVVTNNNGAYSSGVTVNGATQFWTNGNNASPTSVATNNATTYTVSYSSPANSFVTYYTLKDAQNCFSRVLSPTSGNGNRTYFSISGGNGTNGWASGQLPPSPQLKTVASNLSLDNDGNVYFVGTDGNVYNYYFDNTVQQWLLSAPIATGAYVPSTPGSFTVLKVDDGNATPGTKYVYFTKQTLPANERHLYYAYKTGNGTWQTSGQLTSSSNLPGGLNTLNTNIALDENPNSPRKGYVYFTQSSLNQVYMYSPSFGTSGAQSLGSSIIASGYLGVPAVVSSSASTKSAPGQLFYQNQGLLYGLKIGQTPTLIGSNISSLYNANGPIDFDNQGNIFYSTTWGKIYAVPLTGAFAAANFAIDLNDGIKVGNPSVTDAAGSFTFNRKSGILYYTDWNGNIHMLQNQSLIGTDITNTLATGLSDRANPNAFASFIFTAPNLNPTIKGHLFYISGANGLPNYVYNLFDGGCVSNARISNEDDENIGNNTFFGNGNHAFESLISPNPSTGLVTYSANSIGEKNIRLYDAMGKEVFSQTITEIGTKELSFGHLAKGLYICVISGNGASIRERLILE